MKSKLNISCIDFWGEKMSKLTEVNLVENIIKKKLLLELLPIMNVNERGH